MDLERLNVLLRVAGLTPVSDDEFGEFLDWKDKQPFADQLDPDDYVELFEVAEEQGVRPWRAGNTAS